MTTRGPHLSMGASLQWIQGDLKFKKFNRINRLHVCVGCAYSVVSGGDETPDIAKPGDATNAAGLLGQTPLLTRSDVSHKYTYSLTKASLSAKKAAK